MTVPVQSEPQRILGFRAQALRGSHQDYTAGSLNVYPAARDSMVLEMVLESLFAVVDTFWSVASEQRGRHRGLTESILALVFSIGLGVSLSTTAMVARRIARRIRKTLHLRGAGHRAGPFHIVGARHPRGDRGPHLLRLMGASPAIVAIGSGYARIALGGCGAIIMLFLTMLFSRAGDAAIAMRLLWVSNIINFILDPCLIFGSPFPHLASPARFGHLHRAQHRRAYPFYWLCEVRSASHPCAPHLSQRAVLWRLLRVH